MSAAFEAMMMRRRGWERAALLGVARRPHAAGRGVLVPRAGRWVSRGTKKARLLRGQAVEIRQAPRRRRCVDRPALRRIQRMRGEKEWAGMIEIVAFANLYTTRVEKSDGIF